MVCLHYRILYISYLSSLPQVLILHVPGILMHSWFPPNNIQIACIGLRAKYFRALDITTTSDCSLTVVPLKTLFYTRTHALSTREFFRSVESTLFPLLISFSVLRWLLSRSDSLSITSIQVISKTTLILFKPSKVPACFSFADEI